MKLIAVEHALNRFIFFTIVTASPWLSLGTNNCSAQPLLAYEAFTNYAVGNLPGQPYGGLGFAAGGSWSGLDSHYQPKRPDAGLVTTNGMKCLLVASDGGKVTVKGDNSNLRALLDLSTNGPFAAAGLCNLETGRIGGGNVSGTLYTSFLFRAASQNRKNEYGGLHLTRGDTDSNGVLIGNSWPDQSYSLWDASSRSGIDLKNYGGTGGHLIMDKYPHLVVVKISYVPGMANEIIVWLDPDAVAGEANQNSPTTYVGTVKGDYSFDRFILRGGGNNPFDFGEIRIGTTWNSVLPPNVSPNRFPKHDFKAWPAIISAALGTNSVGGYSFLARYHGQIVTSRVGGYARMPFEKDGAGMPWIAAKPMHVASVSKLITASAMMKLWEEKQKRFSLDAPFWPYIKDLFPDATESSKTITIRQLLTHRSGLILDVDGIPALNQLLASKTNNVPGTSGHYNNVNFYLLRLVIERISGETYSQYVRNHLLIPTGASSMDIKPEAPLPTLAYQSGETNRPGHPFFNLNERAGPIGWFASTLDLTAFSYGISNGRTLSKSNAEKMFHEELGWHPGKMNGQTVFYGHGGRWGWFSGTRGGWANSCLVHFVDGVDAAILVNSDQSGDLAGFLLKAWQVEEVSHTSAPQ